MDVTQERLNNGGHFNTSADAKNRCGVIALALDTKRFTWRTWNRFDDPQSIMFKSIWTPDRKHHSLGKYLKWMNSIIQNSLHCVLLCFLEGLDCF